MGYGDSKPKQIIRVYNDHVCHVICARGAIRAPSALDLALAIALPMMRGMVTQLWIFSKEMFDRKCCGGARGGAPCAGAAGG
jgi:hypothetical protein